MQCDRYRIERPNTYKKYFVDIKPATTKWWKKQCFMSVLEACR